MLIKGIVKIIKQRIDTNEVTFDSGWLNNNVFRGQIQNMVVNNETAEFGPNIVISGWDGPSSDRVGQLIKCHNIGTDVVPPANLGTGLIGDPWYTEFQQTFGPPASTIDINTIGLTSSTSVPADGGVAVDAFTKLGATCQQTTIETLIVFYRVQFLQEAGREFTRQRSFGFSQTYGLGNSSNRHPTLLAFTWMPTVYQVPGGAATSVISGIQGEDQLLQFGYSNGDGVDNGEESGSIFGDKFTTNTAVFARRFPQSGAIADQIGRVRGTAVLGADVGMNNTSWIFPWYQKLLPENEGFVQNIYSHSPAADKPFFDPLTIPTTDGTLAINSSGWTQPDFPNMFRIEITSTGAVGVGEYKFRRRRLVGGFEGNTYLSRSDRHPVFTSNNFAVVQGHNVFPSNSDYGYPWTVVDETFLICPDPTGIIVINPVTGESRAFDATNAPGFTTGAAFNATSIEDVEYDELSDTIWFACEDTGIYSINDPWGATPTIAFYDATTFGGGLTLTNNAYTITLGQDTGSGYRKIWAIVNGALVTSSDNGTTWDAYDNTTVTSFTQATLNANWARAMKIKGHPTDVTDPLLIHYDTGGSTGLGFQRTLIDWWTPAGDVVSISYGANETALNTTAEPLNNRLLYRNQWGVSPNDGDWWGTNTSGQWTGDSDAGVPFLLQFGTNSSSWTFFNTPSGNNLPSSTTGTPGGTCLNLFFTTDDVGADAALCLTTGGDLLVMKAGGTFDLIQDLQAISGTVDGGLGDIYNGFRVYFDGLGIFIGADLDDSFGTQNSRIWQVGDATNPLGLTNYEHLLWEDYGWDGANWVLGNPNSKTIHASSDALIDGLTISFDDSGATQTFVSGDYFTTGVVDGIWMDGNTEFDYSTSLFYKPTDQNFTDLSAATAPVATALAVRPQLLTLDVAEWVDVGTNTTVVSGVDIRKDVTSGTGGARLNNIAEGDFSVEFRFDGGGGSTQWSRDMGLGDGTICGVSSAGVIGSGLNRDLVQYGFYFTNQTVTDGDLDIVIRESGVNVATVETALPVNSFIEGNRVRFRIERVGSTINYYMSEKLVHTTAGAPGGNYIFEHVVGNGAENRLIVDRWEPTWTDYWVFIGDGATTGSYNTNYETFDYEEFFSFTIGGSEGSQLLRDRNTVLAAGQYSIFPETGGIRLSAADASAALALDGTLLRNG